MNSVCNHLPPIPMESSNGLIIDIDMYRYILHVKKQHVAWYICKTKWWNIDCNGIFFIMIFGALEYMVVLFFFLILMQSTGIQRVQVNLNISLCIEMWIIYLIWLFSELAIFFHSLSLISSELYKVKKETAIRLVALHKTHATKFYPFWWSISFKIASVEACIF